MSASLGFGTENLIFVPAGNRLRVYDVYNWRLLLVDVLRSRIRLRPSAQVKLEMHVEESLQQLDKRKATAEKKAEYRLAAEDFVGIMRESSNEPAPEPRIMQIPVPDITFWVRITDVPAESFFPADYDEAQSYDGPASALPVYGSFYLNALGGLEIPFPGIGPEAAFELLIPAEEGFLSEPISDVQPLPLVEEFCGATGVSARGNSVNLNLQAGVATVHLGAVPIRRFGEKAYATLYFSHATEKEAEVVQRLRAEEISRVVQGLGQSRFALSASGSGWRVFSRGEDHVHLYEGLEGRESAGAARLPPFLLVAAAGGEHNPRAREMLLKAILESIPV